MAPVGVGAPPQATGEDVGVPVELFENPNLDRYLRNAQAFLSREDYAAAIQVLQDVIEGHTIEVVGGPEAGAGEPGATPAGPERTDPAPAAGTLGGRRQVLVDGRPAAAPEPRAATALDARQSVFSQDGRLYRPVRRLCHELLSRLPSIGIEMYRTTYEVAANELLEQATREGTIGALEQVANRYFVTLPAGRAMVALADRLMHEGRYRVAVQVLRDLVETYPAENRKRLGISEVWCRFKIALCLRLAGEVGAAHDAVKALASTYPDETLRIMGQLQAVKDLPDSAMFAREVLDMNADQGQRRGPTWLAAETLDLVPLWQYRFRNPEPYREPKATNNDNNNGVFIMDDGMRVATMPHASRYGPATWLAFSESPQPGGSAAASWPQALFLEHYCLCVADAATGLQLARGDGVDEPPVPRENHPRVRIASSDFALLRPIEDEARRYVVMGHGRNTTSSPEALKSSELVAYRRETLERVWSSTQWQDGEDGLRDVVFLAAPTVFGERLLLPSLRRSAYTLECLDRTTGRPLWHTPVHAGGSPFFKAPGSPVAVQGGIAYMLTNAGCLAAVDAFAGDLRWIRRYERSDPLRQLARPRRPAVEDGMRFGMRSPQFLQADLPGFLPNDLIVANGLVIFGACDSGMLLCIDGASGEPLWMVDATTHYAPYGNLRTILGATAEDLFALSDTCIVCIGLEGGLLRWSRELPVWNPPKGSTRGRGMVVAGQAVVPGDREILVFDAGGEMRRIPLPAFDASRDPLGGSYDLVSHGPWLGVGYQGGVEMYSSREALLQLADQTSDTLRKCTYLVQAGAAQAAESVLRDAVGRTTATAERLGIETQLLSLTAERAARIANGGDLAGAIAALDGIVELLPDREVRLNWHLARVEICKDAGDLRAHEVEQQRLYDYMEGKG
ncbi:MAG TPA: PQQ-binding-like beta-propeller repeat protein [Planctomycetota bacterium]|nr:PQQ-binding-like beta-propeller repeat protein [Planctomycetota bacterium]